MAVLVFAGNSFFGKFCEYPSCPQPEGTDKVCNNKGKCRTDGSCLCDPGYSGDACHLPDCPGDPECGGQYTKPFVLRVSGVTGGSWL